MPEPLVGVTLDCADLDDAVAFWREALGYELRSGGEGSFRTLFAPEGRPGLHHLTLQQVPEPKTAKARAHLDLFFSDVDAQVERFRSLGAEVLRKEPFPDDVWRTVVMRDPQGNEFCVVELPTE